MGTYKTSFTNVELVEEIYKIEEEYNRTNSISKPLNFLSVYRNAIDPKADSTRCVICVIQRCRELVLWRELYFKGFRVKQLPALFNKCKSCVGMPDTVDCIKGLAESHGLLETLAKPLDNQNLNQDESKPEGHKNILDENKSAPEVKKSKVKK